MSDGRHEAEARKPRLALREAPASRLLRRRNHVPGIPSRGFRVAGLQEDLGRCPEDRRGCQSQLSRLQLPYRVLWLSWVALVVLAGFLFGLAAWFPFTKVRYLWSRLLLAALALLPLVHYLYVFGYQVPHTGSSGSGWIGRQWYVLSGIAAQTASAALVGVALASGFRAKGSESRAVAVSDSTSPL